MVGGIGGPGGAGPKGPGKVPGSDASGSPGATNATHAKSGPKETSFSGTLSANETKSASAAGAAPPVDRLRAGEIDRTQYVELKVHEATAHLDGVLPAEDVARIQDELRDLLENDPDVAALVKRAEVG